MALGCAANQLFLVRDILGLTAMCVTGVVVLACIGPVGIVGFSYVVIGRG